ncbi:hypothetical protein BH11ARM1_BH11ARM1_05960 [soil metagenome]
MSRRDLSFILCRLFAPYLALNSMYGVLGSVVLSSGQRDMPPGGGSYLALSLAVELLLLGLAVFIFLRPEVLAGKSELQGGDVTDESTDLLPILLIAVGAIYAYISINELSNSFVFDSQSDGMKQMRVQFGMLPPPVLRVCISIIAGLALVLYGRALLKPRLRDLEDDTVA